MEPAGLADWGGVNTLGIPLYYSMYVLYGHTEQPTIRASY
jgi:hypothetical protein